MADWTNGMKRLALQTYENSQPCDVCFGTVISVEPISVIIEQMKSPLVASQLIICDHLKKRKYPVSIGAEKGTVEIPSELQNGSKVVMLRKSGGQKYLILSTIGKEG